MLVVIVDEGQERTEVTLPRCAKAIIAKLGKAADMIDKALSDDGSAVELTFSIKGRSTKLKVSTLFE